MADLEPAVRLILEKEYGVAVEKMQLLDGMADRTFLVNDNQAVIKVFLDPMTDDRRQIESESALITFLKARGFPVAEIIPTKSGAVFIESDFFDSEKKENVRRPVRMQAFLKGIMWYKKSLCPAICEVAGDFIGRVDKALEDFKNDYYIEKANFMYIVQCSPIWDAYKLKELVKDDERKYRLCQKTLDLFDKEVVPNLDRLPRQQIHGDFHSRNAMVDDDAKNIIGLIDFGDSRYMLRIYEIAISLPGILGKDPSDDFSCLRSYMRGYRRRVDLTELELNVLLPCVCGRIILAMLCSRLFEIECPETYDESYMTSMFGRPWDTLDDLLNNAEKKSKFAAAIAG